MNVKWDEKVREQGKLERSVKVYAMAQKVTCRISEKMEEWHTVEAKKVYVYTDAVSNNVVFALCPKHNEPILVPAQVELPSRAKA